MAKTLRNSRTTRNGKLYFLETFQLKENRHSWKLARAMSKVYSIIFNDFGTCDFIVSQKDTISSWVLVQPIYFNNGMSMSVKEPFSPRVLCEHAAILGRLKIKFIRWKYGSTLQ